MSLKVKGHMLLPILLTTFLTLTKKTIKYFQTTSKQQKHHQIVQLFVHAAYHEVYVGGGAGPPAVTETRVGHLEQVAGGGVPHVVPGSPPPDPLVVPPAPRPTVAPGRHHLVGLQVIPHLLVILDLYGSNIDGRNPLGGSENTTNVLCL